MTEPTKLPQEELLIWFEQLITVARESGSRIEVVMLDESSARSSVQITITDLPGPLIGFDLRQRPSST